MPSAVSPACSMNMIRAGTCFSALQGFALLVTAQVINQAILRHLVLRSRREPADMGAQATGARHCRHANWQGPGISAVEDSTPSTYLPIELTSSALNGPRRSCLAGQPREGATEATA